jgi:hypothetical protein
VRASIPNQDLEKVLRRILSLDRRKIISLPDAEVQLRQYVSAPLCVIDAVFSLGVRYKSVENVVDRFCKLHRWSRFHGKEHTTSELLAILAPFKNRFEEVDVFNNKQRTSPRSGITKAEAVYRFANALKSHGIETLNDVKKMGKRRALRAAIASIPGQSSGLSYNYFLMLAGEIDVVKADRMVRRFVDRAIGRPVPQDRAQKLVVRAADILKRDYPNINPVILDNVIWGYQSGERVGCP